MVKISSSEIEASKEWNSKGLAFSSNEELDDAIKCYDKAIKLDPNNIFAWVNRGNAYFAKKLYDKAIENYKIAIRIDPNYIDARDKLDKARSAKKNLDNVLRYIDLKNQISNQMLTDIERKKLPSNTQDYDEAIIIQETPRKTGIFMTLPCTAPILIIGFISMLILGFKEVIIAFTLIGLFVCICFCVLVYKFWFNERTFLISNKVIIYDETKRVFFKIYWDNFYQIKFKTVYFSTGGRNSMEMVGYALLFYLSNDIIKEVNLSFSKKKIKDIVENLKIFSKKKNIEFLIEVKHGIQNLKSEN